MFKSLGIHDLIFTISKFHHKAFAKSNLLNPLILAIKLSEWFSSASVIPSNYLSLGCYYVNGEVMKHMFNVAG